MLDSLIIVQIHLQCVCEPAYFSLTHTHCVCTVYMSVCTRCMLKCTDVGVHLCALPPAPCHNGCNKGFILSDYRFTFGG